MLAIQTILHPTDFSKQSASAFQVASALARDYGAKLLLLHVRQPGTMVFGEFGALPPSPQETDEELRARLAQLVPPEKSVRVERFLATGSPAEEILRLAGDAHADLIVLGTHGRTGLGRLLMGSVAERVVRKAPCLVLTVKEPLAEAEAATCRETAPAAV